MVAAAYLLGGIIQVWLGHLTDRFGRKSMLQFSLATASIVVAAHALVPNAIWLALLRACAIFSGGALYPATGAVVTEVAPARYRGIMAGLLQTAYPLGWFVASLVAAPFLALYGWRAMFLVALVSLPYLLVVRWGLRESARFEAVRTATQQRSLWQSIGQLLTPGMRRRTITLFCAQLLFVIAYGGSAIFFPTYFVESRGWTVGSSTILVGLGNAIGVLGYILAAVVGEFYLSRRTTVVVWTLAGTVALVFLVWGTSEYVPTLIAFGVMSMFFYGVAAVKFAYVAEIFPTPLRATGLAVCTSLPVNLGIAAGPLIVATSVEHIGWDLTFSLVVGLPLSCAGLLYLLLRPIPSGLDIDELQRQLAR